MNKNINNDNSSSSSKKRPLNRFEYLINPSPSPSASLSSSTYSQSIKHQQTQQKSHPRNFFEECYMGGYDDPTTINPNNPKTNILSFNETLLYGSGDVNTHHTKNNSTTHIKPSKDSLFCQQTETQTARQFKKQLQQEKQEEKCQMNYMMNRYNGGGKSQYQLKSTQVEIFRKSLEKIKNHKSKGFHNQQLQQPQIKRQSQSIVSQYILYTPTKTQQTSEQPISKWNEKLYLDTPETDENSTFYHPSPQNIKNDNKFSHKKTSSCFGMNNRINGMNGMNGMKQYYETGRKGAKKKSNSKGQQFQYQYQQEQTIVFETKEKSAEKVVNKQDNRYNKFFLKNNDQIKIQQEDIHQNNYQLRSQLRNRNQDFNSRLEHQTVYQYQCENHPQPSRDFKLNLDHLKTPAPSSTTPKKCQKIVISKKDKDKDTNKNKNKDKIHLNNNALSQYPQKQYETEKSASVKVRQMSNKLESSMSSEDMREHLNSQMIKISNAKNNQRKKGLELKGRLLSKSEMSQSSKSQSKMKKQAQ